MVLKAKPAAKPGRRDNLEIKFITYRSFYLTYYILLLVHLKNIFQLFTSSYRILENMRNLKHNVATCCNVFCGATNKIGLRPFIVEVSTHSWTHTLSRTLVKG
jgi:hypothetical protein